MKIGILTHFRSFQPGYALSVGWTARANLLKYFGQDFDFLVSESCPEGSYPNQRNCLINLPENKDFDTKVLMARHNYIKVLSEYDAILTADLIYQKKGNFLVWNQAMRHADMDFQARNENKHWFHWIHSSWIKRDSGAQFPESLRFSMMDRSTLVYMNHSELINVAGMYATDPSNTACVYNVKDPRDFFNFEALSWKISRILDLPNKDIVQVYPHCSTRMQAKGIETVAQVFAELKHRGLKVALIFPNANANQVPQELKAMKVDFKKWGLVENKDYLFTSDLLNNQHCPRKVVADLFQVSNLFVFASWRENCPNILLEAKVAGCLLAINAGLPMSQEFGGDNALYFNSTTKIPGICDGAGDRIVVEGKGPINKLCDEIVQCLPGFDLKEKWRFSFERIWQNQFKPMLEDKCYWTECNK
ncbi:MAG: hypothetical protein WC341_16925 [Bacteroidales bacterium]|jgi:hypothetical protein